MLFVIIWGIVKYLYEDEGLVQFQFLAELLLWGLCYVEGVAFPPFVLVALAVADALASYVFIYVESSNVDLGSYLKAFHYISFT